MHYNNISEVMFLIKNCNIYTLCAPIFKQKCIAAYGDFKAA